MDWATRLRDISFTSVKLGDAYDMDQVDYLLDLLQLAAEQGEPLAPILEGIELNQVRLREGYAIDEVDAFFAEIRATEFPPAEVVVPESTGPEAATPPVVTGGAHRADPAPAPSAPPTAPAPPTVPAPVPTARAQVKRGLLARLFGRG